MGRLTVADRPFEGSQKSVRESTMYCERCVYGGAGPHALFCQTVQRQKALLRVLLEKRVSKGSTIWD
jgi:hypothetical protein